jgi:hypothetical protein
VVEKLARVPVGVEAPTARPFRPSSAAGYEARLPLWPPLPAAATSSTPFFVAYLTAARSVAEVCEPLRLRLTMRAPWPTAQTMAAASSTSENVAPRLAWMTIK